MLITNEVFQAFLVCENKSYLKLRGDVGSQREFTDWKQSCFEIFKKECLDKLRSNFIKYERLLDIISPQAIIKIKCDFIVDFILKTEEFQSHIDAFERLTTPENTNIFFISIRFIPNEKITKNDKLLLAFDAFVLSNNSGKIPIFGKIMYGVEKKVSRIELAKLMEVVRTIINKITAQFANPNPPQLILNKHCPECEFQLRCRQIAIEKDELTLLSGMTQKERKRQHNRVVHKQFKFLYSMCYDPASVLFLLKINKLDSRILGSTLSRALTEVNDHGNLPVHRCGKRLARRSPIESTHRSRS